MNFALFPRVWVPEDTAPGRSVLGAGRLANRLSRPGEDGSRNPHPADHERWPHLRRPPHSKLLNCRRIDPGAPGRGSECAVQRGHRHIQRDSSCRQAISGPAATVPNLLSPLSGELPQPVLAKIPETGMNGTSDTMTIGRCRGRKSVPAAVGMIRRRFRSLPRAVVAIGFHAGEYWTRVTSGEDGASVPVSALRSPGLAGAFAALAHGRLS